MRSVASAAGRAAQTTVNRVLQFATHPVTGAAAAAVGGQIVKMTSGTQTKKKSDIKQSSVSYSGGKFYGTHGRKKVKKFKKPFGLPFISVFEASGSNASVKCAHLIHTTHPVSRLLYLYSQSLVMYVMTRMGVKITNWDYTLTDSFSWSATFYPNSGSVTASATGQTLLGSATFGQLATSIGDFLSGVILDDNNRDILFEGFAMLNETRNDRFTMNFRDFECRISAASYLKIQNRSRNALGSEADEVDNVPLHGTICDYIGSGVYIRDFNRYGKSFCGDATNGLTVIDGDNPSFGTTNSFKEPLRRGDVVKVKKFKKVKIEPGVIKTSVMKHAVVLTLQSLKYLYSPVKTYNRPYVPVGLCRIIGLEKMLATNDVGESAMSIFYELEQNYYVSCRHSPVNQPVKQVTFASAQS